MKSQKGFKLEKNSIPLLAFLILCILLAGSKIATDNIVSRSEARYPPIGDFITVDGLLLHYIEKGGGTPIVLIHGDGGSIYDWKMSIFNQLAHDNLAIAFDRPGLGYSQRPEDGASPFVQAHLIHDALEKMSDEKPILVGYSQGGNVVLAYALMYPDDIAGVVTLAAAPFGGTIAFHNRLLSIPVIGPVLAHTVYVPFGKYGVQAGLESAFAPETNPPADYLEVYSAFELRPGQLLAHAADQVAGRKGTEDMMARYDEIDVPLVIVHGTEDRNVPIEQARRLDRLVSVSHLIEVPGASHEIINTATSLGGSHSGLLTKDQAFA